MAPVSTQAITWFNWHAAGAAFLALVLFTAAVPHGTLASSADNSPSVTIVEQRSDVEKASRSRYRDLEVASLVVILLAGGVAIWWTFRRK